MSKLMDFGRRMANVIPVLKEKVARGSTACEFDTNNEGSFPRGKKLMNKGGD